MRQIITYFVKYPLMGNMLMVAIILFGVVGFLNVRSSFFPQYESDMIIVNAIYPGASPQEVEEGIVVKIEENLQGVEGIQRVSSTSSENVGNLVIEIIRGENIDLVVDDVKNALDKVSSFPEGMEKLIVYKQEQRNLALSFALYGDVDRTTLKEFAEKAKDDLIAMDGISNVEITGYPEEEIEIALKEEKLRAYNLSFEQAATAVKSANLQITGGTLKTSDEEFLIRANNKGYYAEDLLNIVVRATPDGRIVLLRDIAVIRDRWADVANTAYTNGKPAAIINVTNTNDEDILDVTEKTREYITKFKDENDVVKAEVLHDGSDVLQQRIDLLVKNGQIGAILVFLMLALFLRIRLSFWVAMSIPISFMGMFLIASFTGVTINVLSLFGMILVIGILVDDGIVIGENIYQHYERGKPPLQAAIDGTMEVLSAVFSAILTTIIAFSTFFFLDGRLGKFAPDLAIVVIATLSISLVEGAFILPAHIAHSRDLHAHEGKQSFFDRLFNGISSRMDKVMAFLRNRFYAPLLRSSLGNPTVVLAIALALFALTIGAFKGGIVKFTFFPFIEREEIEVHIDFPAGTPQEATERWMAHIEQAAWAMSDSIKQTRPDSLDIVLKVNQEISTAKNIGTVKIYLLDAETSNMKVLTLTAALRKMVGPIEGVENLSYGVRSAFGKPISVSLQSNDIVELESAKEELKESMKDISDLTDVISNDQAGNREISLKLKEKAEHLGLSLGMVMAQVRQGFFGYEVQRLQRGEHEVKIWVRYDEENRATFGDLEDMRIKTPTGLEVPLGEIAEYTIERGIMSIYHLDSKREIRVEADIARSDVSSAEVQVTLSDSILPEILAKHPSVSYSYEGQSREFLKTQNSGKKVIPVVLLFMLFVIILAFRSVSQGLLVMGVIPLGIIGVAWGHWFHGAIISLFSIFGIIALIGIMVNDSLVMVSAMNNLLKQRLPYRKALYEASISRFRPILLTSVTTVAGLGPLILERSFQAQFLVPMAISVAYGLGIATFITLFILPVLLLIINTLKRGAVWLWTGELPTPESVEPAVREMKYENEENI